MINQVELEVEVKCVLNVNDHFVEHFASINLICQLLIILVLQVLQKLFVQVVGHTPCLQHFLHVFLQFHEGLELLVRLNILVKVVRITLSQLCHCLFVANALANAFEQISVLQVSLHHNEVKC